MSQNAELFLNAFNRIENTLQEIADIHDYIPFSKLVAILSSKNAIVKRYRDDLLEYADLRNAIVHNRTSPNYAIAEPHDAVVETIIQIEKGITEPAYVLPEFASTVQAFQLDVSLSVVLETINQQGYSQFPVYKGDAFQGIITSNGITKWLAGNVEEDVVSLAKTSIADVLSYDKKKESYRFISSKTTVYEADEMFRKSLDEGVRLEALLITEHGEKSEHLLGIITPLDVITTEV